MVLQHGVRNMYLDFDRELLERERNREREREKEIMCVST